jgi:hypothetical protein
MPALPSVYQVHVNAPLTNIAEAYFVDDSNFIAAELFPIVPVQKLSDVILRICRKDMFAVNDVRPRAPGSRSQGGGYHVNWDSTYFCREYARHKVIADEERSNADPPLALETVATMQITQLLKIKREELLLAVAMAAASWTGVGTLNNGAWNVAGSTPIQDIDDEKVQMALLTGFQPNTLVINKPTFYALRRHASITAMYRNLNQAEPLLSVAQVAAALDIEKLLVAKSVADYGPTEGQWVGRFLCPNDALLCYTTETPRVNAPSAGYTFSYTAANHAGLNIQIENYRLPYDHKADMIVGNVHFDSQVVEPDLGTYFSNVIAGVNMEVVADVEICE